MIQSEHEKAAAARGWTTSSRDRRYVGGIPSLRIRRMQARHEVRARKAGVDWDLVDLRWVYANGKGLCGICLESVDVAEFVVDHIVPMSKGGPHLLHNLQPAHFSCNTQKGDR